MSEVVEIRFHTRFDTHFEGTTIAGQTLMRPYMGRISLIYIFTAFVFGMCGAGLGIFVRWKYTGLFDDTFGAAIVGAALLTGIYIFVQKMPWRWMAEAGVSARYSDSEQVAIFHPKGMTFRNARSDWRTDWSAVEAIKLGKKTMVLSVSGIAFVLPKSSVGDDAACEELLEKLQVWREAAQ